MAKKKKAEEKPPQKYLVVSSPVALSVDEATGEDELKEVVVALAEQMGIPASRIVDSGVIRVFKSEVGICPTQTDISFGT